MNFTKFVQKILPFIFVIFLTSCATTLNVQIERPAKLDLNGAKTIAVLPFKPYKINSEADAVFYILDVFLLDYSKCDPSEQRSLENLKYRIEKGLANSPYITLIHSAEVQNAIKKGFINPADVYLTGDVTDFYISDQKHKVKVPVKRYEIDEDGNKKQRTEYVYENEFSRYVKLELKYQVVDSSSGKVLSYSSIRMSNSSGNYKKRSNLPSAYSILENELSSAANKILKELQPYTITKSIRLLKDKSKNPDMKNANKLASNFLLQESYDEFSRIYNETELFEAGYNAAILQEVSGNFTTAKEMMEDLYQKTGDKRAISALDDINNEIYQAQRLKEQISKEDESEFLDF